MILLFYRLLTFYTIVSIMRLHNKDKESHEWLIGPLSFTLVWSVSIMLLYYAIFINRW